MAMYRKILVLLFVATAIALTGCQERTDTRTEPIVTEPSRTGRLYDTPPQRDTRENQYQATSTVTEYSPAVPDEEKSSMVYYAKLDLLRLLVCADEKAEIDGAVTYTDQLAETVREHFSDMGFRVLNESPCPGFGSSAYQLSSIANARDADMFVLLKGEAEQVDRFGDFYSFEAKGRGKVVQIAGNELLTTKSAFVRGKRSLDSDTAAESALQQCGRELAAKLSDEVVRKSGRGMLTRRVEVSGIKKSADVDYIRVGLAKKPGVISVSQAAWNAQTGNVVYWVRIDASVKENLAAYLEDIQGVKLKVTRLDTSGAGSQRSGGLFGM